MLRFLARHWQGKGLQTIRRHIPLVVGQIVHEALAGFWLHSEQPHTDVVHDAVAKHADELLLAVAHDTPDTTAQAWIVQEQVWMISALTVLWATHRLPALRQEYDMVSVEEETTFSLTERIDIPLRMDAISKRKGDGALFILDYKTTGYVGEGWADEFQHSLQTLVYTYALAHATQQYVGGMIYEPLVKGKRELMRSGPWQEWLTQNSPLCYHWKGPTGERLYTWTNRKGFVKVAAWEEFATVGEFLAQLPQEVALKVLGTTTAFMPDPLVAKTQLQTIAYREEEFLTKVESVLGLPPDEQPAVILTLFEQNHDACVGWRGRKCQFYDVCHTNYGLTDPMGLGQFEPRVDHHQLPEDEV